VTENNRKFCEMVDASGWTRSEVARRLHKSPGAITQFCQGATRPSDAVMELFRMILAKENPTAVDKSPKPRERMKEPLEDMGGGVAKDEIPELKRKLDEIAESDDDLRMIKQVIDYAHAHRRKKRREKKER
jgi:transcriptional regulator with XRE-family HTH domain